MTVDFKTVCMGNANLPTMLKNLLKIICPYWKKEILNNLTKIYFSSYDNFQLVKSSRFMVMHFLRDLGVIVDCKLKYDSHISAIVQKAHSTLVGIIDLVVNACRMHAVSFLLDVHGNGKDRDRMGFMGFPWE